MLRLDCFDVITFPFPYSVQLTNCQTRSWFDTCIPSNTYFHKKKCICTTILQAFLFCHNSDTTTRTLFLSNRFTISYSTKNK